jgi:hypothetical protein
VVWVAGRDSGREGRKEGGKVGRKGERERGREGGKEEGREGGREGRRKGEREGVVWEELTDFLFLFFLPWQDKSNRCSRRQLLLLENRKSRVRERKGCQERVWIHMADHVLL